MSATHARLSHAVADFYEQMLADPTIAPWFEGVDLARLREHQTRVLLDALRLGRYRRIADEDLGRMMRHAHAGLGISDPAYDTAMGYLEAALDAVGFAEIEVQRAMARVGSMRRHAVEVPAGERR